MTTKKATRKMTTLFASKEDMTEVVTSTTTTIEATTASPPLASATAALKYLRETPALPIGLLPLRPMGLPLSEPHRRYAAQTTALRSCLPLWPQTR